MHINLHRSDITALSTSLVNLYACTHSCISPYKIGLQVHTCTHTSTHKHTHTHAHAHTRVHAHAHAHTHAHAHSIAHMHTHTRTHTHTGSAEHAPSRPRTYDQSWQRSTSLMAADTTPLVSQTARSNSSACRMPWPR